MNSNKKSYHKGVWKFILNHVNNNPGSQPCDVLRAVQTNFGIEHKIVRDGKTVNNNYFTWYFLNNGQDRGPSYGYINKVDGKIYITDKGRWKLSRYAAGFSR